MTIGFYKGVTECTSGALLQMNNFSAISWRDQCDDDEVCFLLHEHP